MWNARPTTLPFFLVALVPQVSEALGEQGKFLREIQNQPVPAVWARPRAPLPLSSSLPMGSRPFGGSLSAVGRSSGLSATPGRHGGLSGVGTTFSGPCVVCSIDCCWQAAVKAKGVGGAPTKENNPPMVPRRYAVVYAPRWPVHHDGIIAWRRRQRRRGQKPGWRLSAWEREQW